MYEVAIAILLVLTFAIGVFNGVFSSMFGIGGALLAIPLMKLVLGMDPKMAIGTSLFLVIPTTLSGMLIYRKNEKIAVKTGIICGFAGMPTAVLGAYIGYLTEGKYLMLMFCGVLFVLSITMLLHKEKSKENNETVEKTENSKAEKKIDFEYVAKTCIIGALVGFLSGILGLGGGFLLTPAFLLVLGLSLHQAIGTSLLAIAIYAIPGAAAKLLLHQTADYRIVLVIMAGSLIGPFIGSRICLNADPHKMQKKISLFLAFMALYLAATEMGII